MPAALAQSATAMSPAEQKAHYETHGYLVFPEMLDAGEVGVLRAALDEVLEEAWGLTETNQKFSVTLGHDGRHHVRRMTQCPRGEEPGPAGENTPAAPESAPAVVDWQPERLVRTCVATTHDS